MPGPTDPDADDGALTAAVLAWGLPRLRDLPWRRTRDPWAVLVSEVMLQQTGVARVIPKWEAFLAAFPTPAACARASLGDVLRLWQGLGYPRRARNLHAAATAMVEGHAGAVPRDLHALLALPGIGGYTARAVLAFAYEADAAVVDTNIARVFARVGGRRLTPGEVQAAADRALAHGDAWAWNQALMDLGATVCTARSPSCHACPLSPSLCAWQGSASVSDPAVGSAGVSGRQSRFEGSDRQARGRLMKALSAGPVRRRDLAVTMGLGDHPARARRLAGDLVAEGLVVTDLAGCLRLP